MGYTTDFDGKFSIEPPLKPEHSAFLRAFANRRHVLRDPKAVEGVPDPIREAAGLPVGPFGLYFVAYGEDAPITLPPEVKTAGALREWMNARKAGGQFFSMNDEGPGVLGHDLTKPGSSVLGDQENPLPGIWCQWVPSEDGGALEWDGGEKFYSYEEWLTFLLDHFLTPWGYKVSGEIDWRGQDSDDTGTLFVVANEVFTGNPMPELCPSCGKGPLVATDEQPDPAKRRNGAPMEVYRCESCQARYGLVFEVVNFERLP